MLLGNRSYKRDAGAAFGILESGGTVRVTCCWYLHSVPPLDELKNRGLQNEFIRYMLYEDQAMAGVIAWAEFPGQFDAYQEMVDCSNRSPVPFAFLIRRLKNATVYGSPEVIADEVIGTQPVLYCHQHGNEAVIYTVENQFASDGSVNGANVTVLAVTTAPDISQCITTTAPARLAAL